MLIIDPATGAMYKLDTKDIKENLLLVSTSFNGNDRSLLIMERDQIPPDAKKEIVLLKQAQGGKPGKVEPRPRAEFSFKS